MDDMIATSTPLIAIANVKLLPCLLEKVKHLHITDEILREIENSGGEYSDEIKEIRGLISSNRIKVAQLKGKEREPLKPLSTANGFSVGDNSAIALFQRSGYNIVLVFRKSEEILFKENGINCINVIDVATLHEEKCGVSKEEWLDRLKEFHRISSG